MEQNLKNKKTISLNRFFIRFLGHALLSFVCAAGLWGCLLYAAAVFRLIIPANAVEQSVSAWRDTLDGHTPITPRDIPAGAGFAFFDPEGALLQTDLEGDALDSARDLASSSEQLYIRRNAGCICLRIDTDTQRVVVAYRLVASFRPPLLNRLFPNAELFFLLLLLLMLLADFIVIALRYARRLNGELQKLGAAADQIRAKNLLFEAQETKLIELNRIMDSLMRLKTDLQRSLEEQWAMQQQKKSQFAALAHDIKTPLAIVSGNAELLSETRQTDEQRTYTAFILEHTAQIHRYVIDMLNLSRPEVLSDPVCNIKELLIASARDVELLGKKRGISCLLQTGEMPAVLPLPGRDIQRILANLTDNAVQYSPENGTVYLDAHLSEDALFFSVRDEGNGFSGETLALAATEFYRGDESRNSREHFGLGLFIAKQIVTSLKGTLRLENAPEKGALVSVSIPLGEKNPKIL